ncbi:hypothetical protein RY831_16690 [Noviherbaspirillum sp. CPCC 100848]|uniref:DUF4034 domain-containing protein n=1 Tax=Noviherbaspirillum album TaxID=3080276 RepID=A0ABU6JAX6_9BURK|nr:hypothetical protein [Noviherbaspirillum sp. CPCC 100848]MEC4720804.1 hypothetical protein [Noviherbaspirillum sp. CPCC 100848]
MITTIKIELTAPQAVNGQRAAYQSLWLLVRLYHAARFEAATDAIRLSELRQQFTDARSLRMFISRAFRDFSRWGIQAGWGEDMDSDPRFLNPDRRSQGPFWLSPGEADKIVCMVNGAAATRTDLLRFLNIKVKPLPTESSTMPMPADFWMRYALAQQNLRQGQLLATMAEQGGAERHPGALAGFKDAAKMASSRSQHALAALGEAQVWRRLDDLEAARKTLSQLRRLLKEARPDEGGYLDAMEQILTAWCAYSQRDVSLTEALLAAMRDIEPRASVVRYHPRIRFEWHNLMALVRRAHALKDEDSPVRQRAAAESMAHFASALDAAFEIGSFDAAQQVAANVGMATWLFASEGLVPGTDAMGARPEALRWLLLSEWLSQRSGTSGQSAWNAIYLMRIARGHCDTGERPSLAAFRAQQPLQPADLHDFLGAGAEFNIGMLPVSDWRALATRLLAAQQHGDSRYSLLQRCGCRLEHAWYATHAGELAAASRSLATLAAEIAGLPASDKAFFQAMLRRFPVEVLELERAP